MSKPLRSFLLPFAAVMAAFNASANVPPKSPLSERTDASPANRESAATPQADETRFTFNSASGDQFSFVLKRADASGYQMPQHESHSSHASHSSHKSHQSGS